VLLKNTYFWVGTGLAASWIFTAVSFLFSRQGAVDWFSRSGAVLCLMAAVANFVLVKVHQRDLAQIFKDQEHSRREKAEEIVKPPATYTALARLSYVTGIVGTAIWGYGDLLL
jgi:FtsH-binding integral membrane protein